MNADYDILIRTPRGDYPVTELDMDELNERDLVVIGALLSWALQRVNARRMPQVQPYPGF